MRLNGSNREPRERALEMSLVVADNALLRSSSTIIRSMFVNFSAILTNASHNGSEVARLAHMPKAGSTRLSWEELIVMPGCFG